MLALAFQHPLLLRRGLTHVGILGGSFNPAHRGHRGITLATIDALALDEAWWLVSPGNPLKDAVNDMAPLPARLASAREGNWPSGASKAERSRRSASAR